MMAKPKLEKFEEMTLEVSDDGVTWSKICGLTNVSVSRAAATDEEETPSDCEDESQPFDNTLSVRSIKVSASADGFWAQSANGMMSDWIYSGQAKHTRLGNLNAASGDTEYEKGKAFLTQMDNSRTKGKSVTASIRVEFETTPERIAKA
jgi:predicted alpha/beta hydrolase family esterase